MCVRLCHFVYHGNLNMVAGGPSKLVLYSMWYALLYIIALMHATYTLCPLCPLVSNVVEAYFLSLFVYTAYTFSWLMHSFLSLVVLIFSILYRKLDEMIVI